MIRRRSQTTLLAAAMAVTAGFAATTQASLSPTGPGESLVFSDEFADNANNWSNVGSTATISTDPGSTGQSVWYPTTAGSGAVSSSVTLPTSIDIANGPIAVYFRVRVDKVNGSNNSRFSASLYEESPDNGFAQWIPIPGGGVSVLKWRKSDGTVGVSSITAISGYPDTSTFQDFRLVFTNNGDGSATVEAFQYDTPSSQYVSKGSTSVMDLDGGLFNQVVIQSDNGDATGRAYFDSVQVTQVPEPATIGLFSLGAFFLLARNNNFNH